jgi:hypothetical protein
MCTNFRQKGVPVLAYQSDCTAESPLPCSFIVRYSESLMSFTLFLQFTFFIDGFDDEQVFTLTYDADNLVADKTTLYHNVNSLVPRERLQATSKQGKPQWKTLSLALKTPCSIWGPSCPRSILPHKSTCPTFDNCFVQLARATETKIAIDFSLFRQHEMGILDKIIRSPGNYTAYSEGTFQRHVQRTTGLAFECAVAVSEDSPPLYIHASDSCSTQRITKRPRQGESL